MGKKLLHTWGYDTEGKVIHVNETEKGGAYTCPLCGDRLIARNGGKVQRPHFAHFKKTSKKCNGTSVLHHLFKEKAAALLQTHISEHSPFPIQWSCPYCSKIYQRNLLQRVAGLSTNEAIDRHTPDILLTDKDNSPLIAIELLVSRKLSKKIIQLYETRGIILIQIRIAEVDWDNVGNKLHHPDSVSFC